MKIIKIGRSSSNDVCVNDPLVSRAHCQIIQDENGTFILIDSNSSNGTYVNGVKRHGQMVLQTTDIVRIGNSTLPWQQYFMGTPQMGPFTPSPSPVREPIADPAPAPVVYNPPTDDDDDDTESEDSKVAGSSSTLGIVALIMSLVGVVAILFGVIKISKFGIFAFITQAPEFIISGVAVSILAYILASVADYKDEDDSDVCASAAQWISGTVIFAAIAFFIYIYTQNPH